MPGLIFSIQALDTRRRAILTGFLLSAMVAWGGFHWIIYVTQYFGNLPFAAALGLQCLFCLVAAPQLVAFYFLGHRLRFGVERQPLFLRPLFWAVLYTALEFLAHFIKIFPENLGNTLVHYLPLAQAASLGGVSLLSFLPLWFGASLAYVRKNGRAALPSAVCSGALILALFAWGKYEKQRVENLPHTNLRVGFVQQNLEEVEKMAERTSPRQAITFTVQRMVDHTEALAAQKPDLILWPETSYPMPFPTAAAQPRNSALYGYANLVSEAV
jgi:apolipoprotein N-acyltransferase